MHQRCKQPDFIDHTRHAARGDEVTDFEWAKDDDHDSGGEVAQGIFQRQTDGKTGGTENRHERGDVDPEGVDRGEHDGYQQHAIGNVADESDQHVVSARFAHGAFEQVAEHTRNNLTDDEDCNRNADLDSPVDAVFRDPVCCVFHDVSYWINFLLVNRGAIVPFLRRFD